MLNRILTVSIFLWSNDVPPPLNTTSCANGNLLHVLVGEAQQEGQAPRDIGLLSSAVATVEESELYHIRVEGEPQPGPPSSL